MARRSENDRKQDFTVIQAKWPVESRFSWDPRGKKEKVDLEFQDHNNCFDFSGFFSIIWSYIVQLQSFVIMDAHTLWKTVKPITLEVICYK